MPAPKKHVRIQFTDAPTPKASPADALISKAKTGTGIAMPSVAGLNALRVVLDHNDTQSGPTKKVGSQAAIDMLRDHYGWCGQSVVGLNAVCRRAFGRKSWGTK
jgi:hypothetical protein